MRRPIGLPLVLGVFCLAAQAAAAGTQGAELAASCASCHRHDGRDIAIPPIAGLDQDRIVRALLAYRAGERPGQIMQVVASALTSEQIVAVARYLAAQTAETARR